MPTNYSGNPAAVQSPSPVPSLLSATPPIGSIPIDGEALNVASISQDIKVSLDYIAYLRERMRDQHFGNGSDGVLNVSAGATDITSLKFYSSVNLSGGTLYTNGWPIIANVAVTIGGAIDGSGGNATPAAGAAGVYHAGAGLDGPHGAMGYAGATLNAANLTTSIYGLGGRGGKGGGATSINPQVIAANGSYKIYPYRFHAGGAGLGVTPSSTTTNAQPPGVQYDSIRGGAAGLPGDAISGVLGGSPGGGGSLIVIIAPFIALNGGSLISNGGNGGTGGAGNSHGGGGGGGGAFLLVTQNLFLITPVSYTANAGTGGAATGSGTAGTAGLPGNTTPYTVTVP